MNSYSVIRAQLFILILMTAPIAHAFESESEFGYQASEPVAEDYVPTPPTPLIEDGSRIRKFELALRTLKIPAEKDPDFTKFPGAGEATETAFDQTMRFIDPERGLRRYLNTPDGLIELYRDFFGPRLAKSYLEYAVDVQSNPTAETRDSSDLMARLVQIGEQARNTHTSKPLEGVRIIIDPGHMGNDLWDEFTGKYVEIYKTVKRKKMFVGRVSEGQLTLWTAFLTANALEQLGAIVQVTREDLAPVSKKDYRTYDYSPYVNQYFYDSLDAWMNNYFHLGDNEFVKKLPTLNDVKEMFPTTAPAQQALRTKLFIAAEDLEARAKAIADFHPDLTIDIHFDATNPKKLQYNVNDVEGYVPGQFSLRETGSRSGRAHALHHALESRKWNESVNLTHIVTGSVAKQLGLKQMDAPVMIVKDRKGADQVVAVKVKDGVYARNVYITRRSFEGLITYLECLHYDFDGDPKRPEMVKEFTALSKRDKTGTYEGMTFKYPGRLDKVAAGIQQGVLQYFQGLSSTPGTLDLQEEELQTSQYHFNKRQ